MRKSFLYPSVKRVEIFKLFRIYSFELVGGDAVRPVAVDSSGSVHSGVGSVDEDILNGEYYRVGVTCHHSLNYHLTAAVPIVMWAVAVVQHLSACVGVKLPYVTKERVVVVSSCVSYAILDIVVGKMRCLSVSEKGKLKDSHSRQTAVVQKLDHVGGYVSEILGDEITEIFSNASQIFNILAEITAVFASAAAGNTADPVGTFFAFDIVPAGSAAGNIC